MPGGPCHPVHFPSSPEADQIQWGGGVVAEIIFQVPADQLNSLRSGTFSGHLPFVDTHATSGRLGRSAYTFKGRNDINSLREKNIYQKFGGGAWPPWPPWLRRQLG